ncbi:MAG: hypothetical protein Q8M17_09425 [Actinomycetota bacterium]|nr:hypothetical protein [Actinomycetota bacterium]
MSDPTLPSEPAAEETPEPAAPAQWPAAAPDSSAAVPPAAPPAYPTAYPPAPAYASGPRTSSNAIVALVLAIGSWVICPIAPAIVALVFASMATKELNASGGALEGQGLVTAAKIVSWINIGFWVAIIVVGAFVLVLLAIAGGLDTRGR